MRKLTQTRLLTSAVALTVVFAATSVFAVAINTSTLSQNSWFSDDTRASLDQDGIANGTNLIGATKTDLTTGVGPAAPNVPGAGVGHDAAIDTHFLFGNPPVAPPALEHQAAVNLVIGTSGSGKSQMSHIVNGTPGSGGDGTGGHALGTALNTLTADYSWMGNGTPTVTASLKLGIKTTEFGTGTSGDGNIGTASSRSGENVWDKVLIYEPGNGNGGTSNSLWQTENVDFNNGLWWLFDRVSFSSNGGSPKTLADWSTDTGTFGGGHTFQDIFNLISSNEAVITSVQFGIGSGNANGSVYVNQLETNFYRSGDTTTFGTFTAPEAAVPEPSSIALLTLGLIGFAARRRRRR